VIEQVQFGAIDLTRVSISPLAAFVPKLNAFQMPYLYRDSDHMWKVLKGDIGKELLASLEPFGFIGLGWFDGGARSFYNNKKPVRTPADLKGLKIRVQESDLMIGTCTRVWSEFPRQCPTAKFIQRCRPVLLMELKTTRHLTIRQAIMK